MITEAYTSIENTMRYYGNETKLGADFPFNFGLIELNDYSNATKFNDVVYNWLDNMPEGKCANWVVSIFASWPSFGHLSLSLSLSEIYNRLNLNLHYYRFETCCLL